MMQLGLDDLKLLSDEDKQRYMVLERLFSSPGWALVVEHTNALALAFKDQAFNAKTWEATNFAKGAASAFNLVANFEAATEAEYQQKVSELGSTSAAEEELENE